MNRPKMILFDYGQTLIDQGRFDGVKGTAAVLEYAVRNKYHRTAEEVQAAAEEVNEFLGRKKREKRHLVQVEVPNRMFTSYLYESQGIELPLSPEEVDRVFWDGATPGRRATEGIGDFLDFLREQGIRTGVVSNLAFCGKALKDRIDDMVPGHRFEFILATSEYLFRKPNRRIFDLALERAGLSAEEVWYVGDDYECDVLGARNAGIYPVWYLGAIDVPYTRQEGVLMVENWGELKGVLQEVKSESY